jgi:hypothetical protein
MNWDSRFDNTCIGDANTHWNFRLGTTSAHTKPRFGIAHTKDTDDHCNLGYDTTSAHTNLDIEAISLNDETQELALEFGHTKDTKVESLITET